MQGTSTSQRERDLRIDFFRGLALVVVFVDHIRGNPLAEFTPHRFGLSDMAEVFVFLSGYVSGISYSRRLADAGFWLCQQKAFFRAAQIYVANVAVVAALLLLVTSLGLNLPQYRSSSVESLATIRESAIAIFPPIFFLSIQTIHFTVLPLYIVLFIGLPSVLFSLRAHPRLTILALSAVYMGVQIDPQHWTLPEPWRTAWLFNPLAWQILFYGGAVAGAMHLDERFPRKLRLWQTLLLIVVLEATFAWLLMRPIEALAWSKKSTLSPLRLAHFFCLLSLMRSFVPPQADWLTSFFAQPFIRCGQNSLFTYCLGGVLAVVATLIMDTFGKGVVVTLAVNLVGGCLLCGAASLRRRFQ